MLDVVTCIIIGVAIVQLPFAIDLIDASVPTLKLGRVVRRWLGFGLFLLLLTLLLTSLYYYFTTFLPEHLAVWSLASHGWAYATHVTFAMFLFVNTVGNFLFAACGDPGYMTCGSQCPPVGGKVLADQASTAPQQQDSEGVQVSKQPPSLDSTEKSDHHCSVCNRCVRHMDHHCPFTTNCAGAANFSDFFLFLCHGMCGLVYAAALSFRPFYNCWIILFLRPMTRTEYNEVCHFESISIVFLPVAAMCCAAGFLLGAHCLLLLRNQSTIGYLRGSHSPKTISLSNLSDPTGKFQTLLVGPRVAWFWWLVPGIYKLFTTKVIEKKL